MTVTKLDKKGVFSIFAPSKMARRRHLLFFTKTPASFHSSFLLIHRSTAGRGRGTISKEILPLRLKGVPSHIPASMGSGKAVSAKIDEV